MRRELRLPRSACLGGRLWIAMHRGHVHAQESREADQLNEASGASSDAVYFVALAFRLSVERLVAELDGRKSIQPTATDKLATSVKLQRRADRFVQRLRRATDFSVILTSYRGPAPASDMTPSRSRPGISAANEFGENWSALPSATATVSRPGALSSRLAARRGFPLDSAVVPAHLPIAT